MPDFKKPAEKIDPRDPEAVKKAGFGNPSEKFDPESEMAEVAADAAQVEAINESQEIPGGPVTAPHPKKKSPKRGAAKKPAAKEQPPPQEEQEDSSPTELSDDPTKRLKQVAAILQEEYGEGTPSSDDLMKWKQMHGDIFVLPVGERTFIYRYLKRAEWNKIQADESLQSLTEMQVDDYLFDRCVLWPSIDTRGKAYLPAGLIGAICEQIRINSMFIPPERLAQFTTKL